jgi:2-(1,2-epoxy-1,2-dihydrophenyl)acetyl-CoA isomerase
MESNFNTLKADKLESILKITFNRPAHLNALNGEMIREFNQVLDNIYGDHSIKVVILQGAGDNFMSGSDLNHVYAHLKQDKETAYANIMKDVEGAQEIIRKIHLYKRPFISMIQGACAGFGLGLAMASDFAVASDNALFSVDYRALGLSPDGGITYHLPRIVGSKKANEILMLGKKFDAHEASDLGIITQVVKQNQLVESVNHMAVDLQSSASVAIGHIKELINTSFEHTLAQQLTREKETFVYCSQTDDFQSGIEAFFNKYKPFFQGR